MTLTFLWRVEVERTWTNLGSTWALFVQNRWAFQWRRRWWRCIRQRRWRRWWRRWRWRRWWRRSTSKAAEPVVDAVGVVVDESIRRIVTRKISITRRTTHVNGMLPRWVPSALDAPMAVLALLSDPIALDLCKRVESKGERRVWRKR